MTLSTRWRISRSNVPVQFVWYLLVGGLSFLADLAVFAALLNTGAPVIVALVVGFALGTVTNYVLSRILAFTAGRYRLAGEFVRLVIVALIGLGLTVLLVTLLMDVGELDPIPAKMVATVIALAWNYLGRRLFVFYADMPLTVWRLSVRVLGAAQEEAGCSPERPRD